MRDNPRTLESGTGGLTSLRDCLWSMLPARARVKWFYSYRYHPVQYVTNRVVIQLQLLPPRPSGRGR